jgi:hypothetical protein
MLINLPDDCPRSFDPLASLRPLLPIEGGLLLSFPINDCDQPRYQMNYFLQILQVRGYRLVRLIEQNG